MITASTIGAWNIVQSDWVGKELSSYITKRVSSNLDAKIKFQSLDIFLYPPAVQLNNVSFKRDDEYALDFTVDKLGVEIDTIKSMQKELTIQNIYLVKGSVNLKTNLKASKSEDSKLDFSIRELARKVESDLPFKVSKLSLREVKLKVDDQSAFLDYANISPHEKYFNVALKLSELKTNTKADAVTDLELGANIFDEKITLKQAQIFSRKSILELSGEIFNYKVYEKMTLDVSYKLSGSLLLLNEVFNLKEIGEMGRGVVTAKGEARGSIEKFNMTSFVEARDFVTPFCDGDLLELNVVADESEVRITRAKLVKDKQRLEVNKDFQFINLKTNSFIDEGIRASVTSFELKNALKYLKDPLSVLDSKISGEVEFILNENDFHFLVPNKLDLISTSLIIDKNKILNIPQMKIENASFDIVAGKKFKMNTKLLLPSSELLVKGEVDSGIITFSTNKTNLNIEELGLISGLDIRGRGQVKVDVTSNNKDSKLLISLDLKEFSLNEYSQETLSSKLVLDFNSSKLFLNELKASAGRTKTEADLAIKLEDLSVEGDVSHKNIVISEVLRSTNIRFDSSRIPVQGSWLANYKLSGILSPSGIVAKGEFYGVNNIIYDETFESIGSEFILENNILRAQNIKISKSDGLITGEYVYDIKKEKSIFDLNSKKVLLEEIGFITRLPLGINGQLGGKVSGVYENSLTHLKAAIYISNSKIPGKKIGDSSIFIDLDNNEVKLDASLLGDKILIDSINSLKNEGLSRLNYNIKLDDINEVIGTNRLVNLDETNIIGSFYSAGTVEYQLNDFKILNSKINLKKIHFEKDSIDFSYENEAENEILIKDGDIKKWMFYLRGKNLYFISNAKGSFNGDLNLETDFKVDASIFEIMNKVVSKANGPIYGKYKVTDISDFSKQKIKLKTDGITLSTANYPLRFEDIKFLISADNEKIQIENFSSRLGSGNVNVAGGVTFSEIIPKVDIDFKFIHSGVNIFEKSNMIFSGQGSLKGSSFPYKLQSNLYIERLNIVNEFTDLISDGSSIRSDIKYLPSSEIYSEQNFIDLDIDVKTVNPINIKNSMADLTFLANLKVSGSELSPRARGSVYLAPGINKIFFKSNEYNITKANILFFENRKISNPEIDIEASSKIDKYRLSAKVNGPVSNFSLDLRTDPYLEKSDILSLVAFGYTENASSSLSEEQKALMTQAGIGSLLFERFKINETLKNELGIQLNLGTEVSTQSESYLSQRSGTANNGQRVTSATKIEVKKEITSDIDLSVSSTIGSGVGQKQKMNLDYKVSDKLSLEGVYENRTDSQAVNQGQDTSIGVDVRVRWTFK